MFPKSWSVNDRWLSFFGRRITAVDGCQSCQLEEREKWKDRELFKTETRDELSEMWSEAVKSLTRVTRKQRQWSDVGTYFVRVKGSQRVWKSRTVFITSNWYTWIISNTEYLFVVLCAMLFLTTTSKTLAEIPH